jgi:FAD:protein FMN transferase
MFKTYIFIFLILLGACSKDKALNDLEPSRALKMLSFTGNTMGTYYRVKIVGKFQKSQKSKFKEIIEGTLFHVNKLMSTYIADSQISLFNKHESTQKFKIHESFYKVVKKSMKFNQISNGAFDITVMPLVNLWGFGPNGPQEIPSEKSLKELLKFVGSNKLLLAGENMLKKKHPKLQIDLSAIAKGYGVDAVFMALNKSTQIDAYLIEIGGELRAAGYKPDGTSWKIGIEAPERKLGKKIQKIIKVQGNAIATSGSYRNFFKSSGRKFSHTMNIKTGKPIKHKLVSATVITESCLDADAWATTLMALGPDKAMLLANKENLKAYLIIKNRNGYVEKSTIEMQKYFSKNEIK